MERLVELSVKVGLVAHDLVEGMFVRQEARGEHPVDFLHDFGCRLLGKGLVSVAGSQAEIVADAALGVEDGLAFIEGEALKAPEEEGDTSGEHLLQVALRREAGEEGVAMSLPLFFGLKKGNDGGKGEYAVPYGVEANDGLALGCFWSSSGHLGYVSTYLLELQKGQGVSGSGQGVICLVKKGVFGCACIRETLYGNTRSPMAGRDGLSLDTPGGGWRERA